MMLISSVLFLIILSLCHGLQRPLVIGHRGTAYLPELTLASQSMAHAYGADIIEIDICLTRDNQALVIHGKSKIFFQTNFSNIYSDIYLDGVSDVSKQFPNRSRADGLNYVLDFTLSQIRQLNIHERVWPSNGSQVYPSRFPANSTVPFQLATLNETIELILGLNRATGHRRELLIEIKKPEYHWSHNRSISSVILNILNAYNLHRVDDPIILQTFHIEELMHIRQNLGSELRMNALITFNAINESSSDYDYYRSEEGIRNLSKIVQALAPEHSLVVNYDSNGNILGPTDLTRWAHQYDLHVYPFTFRMDRFPGSSFERLIEYFWRTVQVDGFITDHPDIVLELLARSSATRISLLTLPLIVIRLFNLVM